MLIKSSKLRLLLKVLGFLVLSLAPGLPILLGAQLAQPSGQQNSSLPYQLLSAVLTTSWVIWVLKLAYDFWDWVYFHVNRLVLRIFRSEVIWTMSLELTGDLSPEKIEQIYKQLRKSEKTTSAKTSCAKQQRMRN